MADWGGGVFANCLPQVQSFVIAGWTAAASAAAPLALADQLPLLMIVKRGWSGFVPVRRVM